jgi:hypothetical protein
MAKPTVNTNPVANQYTSGNERIIEFSDRKVGGGGLISLRRTQGDDRLMVSVYRCDPIIDVIVGKPDEDDHSWHAKRTAVALAEEGLRRLALFAPWDDIQDAIQTVKFLKTQVEGEMPASLQQ